MKNTFRYYFPFAITILLFSCSKNRDQIRVKNSFSNDIHVIVGPVDYGQVKSVSTTDYRSIPKGNQTISGDINGSIIIPSKGKHKYTININTGGIVTLIDDNN